MNYSSFLTYGSSTNILVNINIFGVIKITLLLTF